MDERASILTSILSSLFHPTPAAATGNTGSRGAFG